MNARKLGLALNVVIVILISYQLVINETVSIGVKVLCVIGLILIQVNDFLRKKYKLSEHHRVWYDISMVLSITIIGIYMVLFDSPATGIYYFFPIVEIFLLGKSIKTGIVIFHVIVYLAGMYVSKADLQSSLIPYLATLLLIYLFRGLSLEREKGQRLNAELVEAHAKLKEITIEKERTRIAQEMHDSIGHSLIALRMHLEFAENMIEANPQKAGEALSKAHDFSKKSIKELRKAVDILKDSKVNGQIGLGELLNDMIESLGTSGKLKFKLHFDQEVEFGSQDMKNCIYNSVREAVTNGLKHGKAEEFVIEITNNGKKIQVIVEDNGEGCSQIKKSHGLRGIEERIGLMNGKVSFLSEKGQGFKLLAEIPV